MRRRVFAKISLVAISTVLSVVVVDFVTRSFYDKKILVRPTPIFKNRWPIDARLDRYESNISFSGQIVGGLALMNSGKGAIGRHVEFLTDRNGFRNSHEALRRSNDVIVVGDSFGAGGGSSQENMLCSLLTRNFGHHCYNISIGGSSPWQELMTLKYEYKNIPKANDVIVLWLLFAGNDLDEGYHLNFEASPNGSTERFVIKAQTYFNRSPIRRMLLSFIRGDHRQSKAHVVVRHHAGRTILFYKPYSEQTNRTIDEVKNHPNYDRFIDTLNTMNEFTKEHHLKLAVVLIPAKEEIYQWLVDDREVWSTDYKPSSLGGAIRQVIDKNDGLFLDLKPIFLEESRKLYEEQEAYLYWQDDTHWNDYGQKVASEAISDVLENIRQGVAADRVSAP